MRPPDVSIAGQAITSSSADTTQNEPGQAAPEPARDAILPRSLRLTMMTAPLAAAVALGSLVGSINASAGRKFLTESQQRSGDWVDPAQLCDIDRNPSRLIFAEQLGCRAPVGLLPRNRHTPAFGQAISAAFDLRSTDENDPYLYRCTCGTL